MKEFYDIAVSVGLKRRPKKIFDEIERISARMIREGWELGELCLEECMGQVHLIFERESVEKIVDGGIH